jgi:hypothetical protein
MDLGRTVVGAQARRRWALVLAVVVLLCAVPVALQLRPAHAAEIDPAALKAKILASRHRSFQGYAQSAGLVPLPPLPNLGQVTALVSSTTELRTWYAAPDRWRVDVLGPGTEHDLYQTPDAQWIWDYGGNQLSRVDGDQAVRLPRAADLTPPTLTHSLLDLSAGERLQSLPGRRVAGLDAAGLRIVPISADTTVDHIDVWADPGSGLPVQAEVTAKGGSRPVFVTRFLELHLSTPNSAVLTPPAARDGIGFTETDAPDLLSAINRNRFSFLPDRLGGRSRRDAVDGVTAVGVYGSGLTQFVVISLPGRFGYQAYDQAATYGTAVTVPDGDAALIGTGLLSVLVVRGRRTFLVAGLVQPAALKSVAVELSGAAA